MLVLTRKAGQSIVIGEDIEIYVVQVRGSGDQAQVRLGIQAPVNSRILRREIFDEIALENRLASQGTIDLLGKVAQLEGRRGPGCG